MPRATFLSGTPGGPTAVATWSAPTEFGRASDGVYGCDGALGDPVTHCWLAVIQYLGCDIRISPTKGCSSRYAEASPVSRYTPVGPPAFVANADGELVYVVEATDMATAMTGLGVTQETCIIRGSSSHGRGYLFPESCNGDPRPPDGPSVLDSTVAFLMPLVTP